MSTNMESTFPSHIDSYRNHPTVRGTEKEDQYQHKIAAKTRRLEAQRTTATEQLLAIQREVGTLEAEHSISPRWTPGCIEWESAIKREALDEYHDALRDLQSLVVQRIAELDKANSAGTGKQNIFWSECGPHVSCVGYKAREQIAKAINRRAKAVHNALGRYNTAALRAGREQLSFKELSDHAYLANFDFLKYSEHGAQDAEWSRPVNRRCVEVWHKIERAKEEIIRLNIEIRRVQTHIRDEEEFLSCRYDEIKDAHPDLAHALLTRMKLTVRINQRIRRDLEAISKLKGFTGDLEFGTALASMTGPSEELQACQAKTASKANVTDDLGDMHEEEMVTSVEVIETEPTEEAQQAMTAIEGCEVQ
jgi:hypothetical protein